MPAGGVRRDSAAVVELRPQAWYDDHTKALLQARECNQKVAHDAGLDYQYAGDLILAAITAPGEA